MFAHHFSGHGTDEALATYRSEFRPSDVASEPTTFLTVNASVADTAEEAEALMLPNLQLMARLRTGQPLTPVDLVEDARALDLSPQATAMVQSGLGQAVVGDPAGAAEQLHELRRQGGVRRHTLAQHTQQPIRGVLGKGR